MTAWLMTQAPATPHERLPIALWTSVWGLIESASSETACCE